jgi:hypothetical protein
LPLQIIKRTPEPTLHADANHTSMKSDPQCNPDFVKVELLQPLEILFRHAF